MSHFWTTWDPVRSSGGFFKVPFIAIFWVRHTCSILTCFPMFFFLEDVTHQPNTSSKQNVHKTLGFLFFFKPTPPFILTKSGSQTNLLNLPSTLGRQPFSSKKPKWQLLHSLLPLPQRRKKSERFLEKLFGGWQRFWGRGWGCYQAGDVNMSNPSGWRNRWDFQVGFSSSASVQGESNPLLFVVSLFMSGPCLCNCFNKSPKSDSTHENKSIKCHQHGSVWLDIPRDVTVLWQVNGFVVINRWEVVAWTGCCFAGVCKTSSFH